MPEIKISCGHCGQHILCDDSHRGIQIDCPSCQQVVFIPAKQMKSELKNALTKIIVWTVLLGLTTSVIVYLTNRHYERDMIAFDKENNARSTSISKIASVDSTPKSNPAALTPQQAAAENPLANNLPTDGIDPATGLPLPTDEKTTLENTKKSDTYLRQNGIDPETGLPIVAPTNNNPVQNDRRNMPKSSDGAVTFDNLKSLAEQGDADAQYKLAACYDLGLSGVTQNYQEALKWYRKAANQGNATAQANLGRMYDDGKGVPKNYQEAVRWYKMAADNGDAVGQNNLGAMYACGTGVSLDTAGAAMLYRKSAEQGYAGGELNLGCFYMYGTGVPRNYVEAYAWISLAAAQGFPQASDALEEVAKRMTQGQIAKAQEQASSFVLKKSK